MTVTTPRRTPRIPLDELCRLPNFYLPQLSWKRDRVAFYGDRTGRIELYVMDLATREVRQVSHGEMPRSLRTGFCWDRTDRTIFFGRDEAGNEQHDIFRIDLETGAVTQLTAGGIAEHHAVELSPDNQWLLVRANRRTAEAPEKPGQMNLWRMRVDGSALEPVTRLPFPVEVARWSPDGQWIAFVSNDRAEDLRNRSGFLVRPDGSALKRVLHVANGSQEYFGFWHADGRRIAVSSDASGQARAGVLDVETGEIRWLTPLDQTYEEYPARFAATGDYLVCFRYGDGEIRPVLYDLGTGVARELRLPPGIGWVAQPYAADRKLLVSYATDTTRAELVAYDLASDQYATLLPAEYGSIDPSLFVDAEYIWYESVDGLRIPAILYVPRERRPGEKLPAIVNVHGGPTFQWYRGFDPYAQFLADRGYVVIEPNIRGSTGYGVAFRDAAIKDWGGKDLEDVAAAARYVGSLPYVDAGRIAVFGGSYGGFMTFMAATKKPDLWRAAVAWIGISDLHAMWAESKEHFRSFLREQMGDPEADRALWRDRSAIEFADRLRAKLLMIHGANDPRCPVSQSRGFRDRLVKLGRVEGVDFEYVEYADEGHGSADVEQRIRTFQTLGDYLERVL